MFGGTACPENIRDVFEIFLNYTHGFFFII